MADAGARQSIDSSLAPKFRPRSARAVVISIFLFLLFTALFAPTLGQAESSRERWENAIATAKKERKVVVFGPAGEGIRTTLVEGFKKAFPEIALEYVGGRAVEQAARMNAERDGGIYSVDVFIGGAVTMMNLAVSGALVPIEPVLLLPEVKDPRNWRGGRLEFSNPSTRLTLVFSSQPNAPVIYDLKQVKPADVDELYELLDRKWKGMAVLNDPFPAGPASNLFHWLWKRLGPEKATDYFTKLRAQAGAVDRDQRRQIEWIARGKYAWLVGPNNGMLDQLARRGLKFGIVPEFKDYGTFIGTGSGCIALMSRAPHPGAAVVYLNWFLNREAQALWNKATNLQSRRSDLAPDEVASRLLAQDSDKYWVSYYETDAFRSPREEAVIAGLFGR